jgi:AcrR family transcriptional regulator
VKTARLSRDDWVGAALTALMSEGAEAVAVQPLARSLETTKGSFYWHFRDRHELLAAALEAWVELRTERVIDELESLEAGPEQRLTLLFAKVTEAAVSHRGELRLLASADEPLVAAAVAAATERRTAYVAGLLRSTGLAPAEARRRAVLAYAAYLGIAQLSATSPDVLPSTPRGLASLRRALVDAVLPRAT